MIRKSELKKEVNLFEEIVRHAPVACFVIREIDDTVKFANEKVEGILGYPHSEVVGKQLTDFIKYRLEKWGKLKRIIKEGEYFKAEDDFKRNDQRVISLKYEATKFRWKDGKSYFIFFIRNVSDQILARSLYRHVFENADDWIYTVDLEGRFTSVNQKFLRMLGYTAQELIGKQAGELGIIRGENRVKATGEFEKRIYDPRQVFKRYKVDVHSKEGSVFSVDVSAVPIIEDGKVTGVQGIARDVTAAREYEKRILSLNKELEDKVKERTEKLREALSLKDQMLSDVSHELRTPLTIINLVLENIQEDSEFNSTELGSISYELDRIEALISDLSLVALPVSEDTLFPLERGVDISLIASQVLERLSSLFKKKSLTVVSEFEKIVLDTNRELFDRLLANLLTNATKYSKDKGEIIIRIFSEEQGMVLEVQDFGAGIPLEKQKFIFERFYQVDQSRDRGKGGVGLGLSIVKWIVEKHRGDITVKSKEGEGTLFRVVFPRISSSGD